jgi:hypothetical protein
MSYHTIKKFGRRLTREIGEAESRGDQKLVNELLMKKSQLAKVQARYVRFVTGKSAA